MYSSLIGKIEKAKRYAQELDRVSINQLSTTFRGDHSEYQVEYQGNSWRCTCSFFISHGICSHTMALQRVLEGMISNKLPVHH